MNKKLLALFGVTAGAAALTLHTYLDIMYKETIPKGPMKRLQEAMDNGDMDALGKYTDKSNEWNRKQKCENIDLTNKRGEVLKGYFYPAENESKLFCVFAHGYRADHNGDPANFIRYYHEKGYNFFSCDHTAAGRSDGDFVGFDYFESQDMLEWLDYLIGRFGEDIKIVLHGVSMGGATVCKMADKVPEQVKIIVADCPYTSAQDEFIAVAKSVGINKTAPAIFKGFNELNKWIAHYDLLETDVRDNVKNSKVPMLFVHGADDDFVPTRMGVELCDICRNDKDIYLVANAKHAESIVKDTEGYLNKLSEFIDKYVD